MYSKISKFYFLEKFGSLKLSVGVWWLKNLLQIFTSEYVPMYPLSRASVRIICLTPILKFSTSFFWIFCGCPIFILSSRSRTALQLFCKLLSPSVTSSPEKNSTLLFSYYHEKEKPLHCKRQESGKHREFFGINQKMVVGEHSGGGR